MTQLQVSEAAEQRFLSEDAVWRLTLLDDGQVLWLDIQLADEALGLYYSVQTHALCVAPDTEH